MPKYRKQALLFFAAIFAVLYCLGCLIVLQNNYRLEKIANRPVTPEALSEAKQASFFRSAGYYRELANRAQYYPHDPNLLPVLYAHSLLKAPADYQNFFAYAYYLASRNCCRDNMLAILEETVKRCPTNSIIYRNAAVIFLAAGDKDRGLVAVRKALELDPYSAHVLYPLLTTDNVPFETILSVTPGSPNSQIQLIQYLLGKGNIPVAQDLLNRLEGASLDPSQRISFARLAMQAGLNDLALKEATEAAKSKEYRADALQTVAELAYQKKDWQGYNAVSKQIESELLERNGPNSAAAYALSAAIRMTPIDGPAGLKERTLRITNEYPHYAPGYAQMADLASDSTELELFYIKKATEQDPSNIPYKKRLAALHLKLLQPEAAEKIYRSLLLFPEYQKDAYLGLADCRLQAGDRQQAIVFLEQGVEQIGPSEELLYRLGQLYESIGEYQKAARTYLDYANLGNNKAKGFNLAGDAFWKLGRYAESAEQYRKVLGYDPQNSHAKEFLLRLKSLGY